MKWFQIVKLIVALWPIIEKILNMVPEDKRGEAQALVANAIDEARKGVEA